MPLTDAFVTQIHDLLEHLFDYPYLQEHTFGKRLDTGHALSPQQRMRLLRTTLLDAIDQLNPGLDEPVRSSRARSFNVLNLHYVEGLMVQEVARELAVSRRQIYRDLRRAELALATLLAPKLEDEPQTSSAPAPDTQTNALLREAGIVAEAHAPFEVDRLIEGILLAVRQLARDRDIEVVANLNLDVTSIVSDRQLIRQTLLGMLSGAIQNAVPGSHVIVNARDSATEFSLEVSFVTGEAPKGQKHFPELSKHLVAFLGGQCTETIRETGQTVFALSLPLAESISVLVIDDNAGLIELIRRYLAGLPYRVVNASSAAAGLALAQQIVPSVILLDVMMPQQDGWELLQCLQTQDDTREIPVIVCSVVKDPELAYSLGATAFLAKPVNRAELLGLLTTVLQEDSAR